MIPAQRAGESVAVIDLPEQQTAADLDRRGAIKKAVAKAHAAWQRADLIQRQQIFEDLAAVLHRVHADNDIEACRRMAVAILHRLEGGR